MNHNATSAHAKALPRWGKLLLWALFLASILAFVWGQLPKGGFPTDLSRIGAGRATAVLAFDQNYAGGTAAMALLNEVRVDYADKVDFLVAHLAMADGKEFARRHAAQDGTVILFAADGSLLRTLHQPKEVGKLREALNQAYGL